MGPSLEPAQSVYLRCIERIIRRIFVLRFLRRDFRGVALLENSRPCGISPEGGRASETRAQLSPSLEIASNTSTPRALGSPGISSAFFFLFQIVQLAAIISRDAFSPPKKAAISRALAERQFVLASPGGFQRGIRRRKYLEALSQRSVIPYPDAGVGGRVPSWVKIQSLFPSLMNLSRRETPAIVY